MFIALEMSDRPFDSSLFGISFPPVPAISKQVLFRSPSVDSSEIYDPSYTDLEKGLNIRNITNMMPGDRWLAYATPTLPSLTPRSPSWGSAWMSVIHRPNIYGTTSLQTAPPSPAVSDLSRHSSPGAMRRPSTTSTVSPLSSRMPSTLRRSPLSTMRRASNPEVPVLPEFVKRRSRMPLPEGWTLPAQLVIGQMSELAKGRQASSTLVPLPALVVTKNRTSKSPQIPDLDNGESFSAILSESIRAGGKGQIALDDSKASVVEIDSSSEIGRLDVGGGETRKGKATAGRRLEQQQQQLQSGGIPGGQSGRR
ncbi:MAG: hypothetical protein M1827_000177 [Pycnora praestabilis]|nr:MAG: hypothetical protein M1827_000177 [Pycnora praestabilis]